MYKNIMKEFLKSSRVPKFLWYGFWTRNSTSQKLVKQLGKISVFSTLSNYLTQNRLVFLPVRIGVIQIKSSAVVKINLSRDIQPYVQTIVWLAQFIKEWKTFENCTVFHYPTPTHSFLLVIWGPIICNNLQ